MTLRLKLLLALIFLLVCACIVQLDINLNLPDLMKKGLAFLDINLRRIHCAWLWIVDFVDINYERGGWHRLGMCFLLCSPMLGWCIWKMRRGK